MSKEKQSGRFRRLFRFALDVKERANRADISAAIVGQVEQLAHEKAEANKKFNEAITAHRSRLSAISRTVRNGYEERMVECEARRHGRRPVIQLVRLDTGEVYDERAMTEEEKQLTFGDKWDAFAAKLAEQLASPEVPDEELEEEEPAKKRPEPEKPTRCPAPETANADGFCGADGDPKNQGFCKWHVDKFPDAKERRAMAKAADKKRANGNGHAKANGQAKDDNERKAKAAREELADDAQRCLDCGEVPCVCDERTGDNA